MFLFKKKTEDKTPRQEETFPESIAGIASVLVSGLFIITFVVQAFEIPSSSMEDTLLIGDHVFVDRLTPAAKPGSVGPILPYREVQRGDIVVFISPSEKGLYVVKRIIGVPGDHIKLVHQTVYRNGQPLTEPFVKHLQSTGFDPFTNYRDNFPAARPDGVPGVTDDWAAVLQQHIQNGEVVVPPDSYFGMGDNRDVSLDSRYWGFIPRANVIGRPLFVYWSFETPVDQYLKTEITERGKFVLHVILHFFDETRWRRMFRLVH